MSGAPFDSDSQVVRDTVKAMIKELGWKETDIAQIRVAGRTASLAKIDWKTRNLMMTEMVRGKGNHRVSILRESHPDAMTCDLWYDIDCPKLEREYKKMFSASIRSFRERLVAHHGFSADEAKRKVYGNYQQGFLFFKEQESGRNLRFAQYRLLDLNRAGWTAPSPRIPLFDEFDIGRWCKIANQAS